MSIPGPTLPPVCSAVCTLPLPDVPQAPGPLSHLPSTTVKPKVNITSRFSSDLPRVSCDAQHLGT